MVEKDYKVEKDEKHIEIKSAEKKKRTQIVSK